MSKEQKLKRFRQVSESLDQFDLFQSNDFAVPNIQQFSQECYDAFQKTYSQNIPISQERINDDDSEFLILNRNTGLMIDYRNLEEFKVPEFDLKELAWKDYWKQSRELSEQLLQLVQQNEKDKILKLFATPIVYVDFNIKDLDNWTPLHFACKFNNLELVQFLLIQEADPKLVSLDQKSPLHIASIKSNSEICELLINFGANLDEQDSEFNTPLHIASKYGNVEVCEVLLKKNANNNLKNNQNLTPIELTSEINIIEVYDKYGISLNSFSYSRTVIKELNLILKNSRRDHVERLLKLNKKEIKKCLDNITEHYDNTEQRTNEITSTWNKIINFATSFYRVSIKGNTSNYNSENQQNKIGPQSFQFYQKLGEGGFGEVYLVEKIGQLLARQKQFSFMIEKSIDLVFQLQSQFFQFGLMTQTNLF